MPAILKTTQIIEPSSGTTNITLDSSGNVGVGSSSPESTLTVAGTSPSLYIAETTTSANAVLFLKQYGTNSEGLKVTYNSATGDSTINNVYSAGSLYFQTASATRMTINSSGYVTAPYQPYLRAIVLGGTSNLSFTGTGPYVIPYNSIVDQVGSNFNTSTYRFTAPVAGVYMVSAAVEGNGITSVWVNLFLRINGSNFAGTFVTGRNVAYDKIQTDGVIRCSAGDYIDVAMSLNSSGGYLELLPGDTRNSLFITFLH